MTGRSHVVTQHENRTAEAQRTQRKRLRGSDRCLKLELMAIAAKV
ncbi:MAG: hypothetical protein V7K55_01995 [Nostoc sp.]